MSDKSDHILCQITSKPYSSAFAVQIDDNSFQKGSLPIVSYIRPDKIFTADQSVISKKVASLTPGTLNKVKKILATVLEI